MASGNGTGRVSIGQGVAETVSSRVGMTLDDRQAARHRRMLLVRILVSPPLPQYQINLIGDLIKVLPRRPPQVAAADFRARARADSRPGSKGRPRTLREARQSEPSTHRAPLLERRRAL